MTIKNANFNKIVIIQSLKDYQTGNKLQDDLSILTIFTNGIVSSDLIDVVDKKDFFTTLSRIKKDVLDGMFSPIIHIEAHGNEDNNGLILASGEPVTWLEMKVPLSGINEATRFNLIVCISACYGGNLAKAIETYDRAPCWALVGPKEKMYPEDLLKDYTGFYEEVFKTKNGSMAIQRLNKSLSGDDAKYYFTTAEWFFEMVWINYLRVHCSKENLDKRANEMLKKLRKENLRYLPSRNKIKNDLLKCHPDYFNKSKVTFFMMDLFQENQDRFLIDFESILHKSHEAQPSTPADASVPRR